MTIDQCIGKKISTAEEKKNLEIILQGWRKIQTKNIVSKVRVLTGHMIKMYSKWDIFYAKKKKVKDHEKVILFLGFNIREKQRKNFVPQIDL